MKHRLVIALGMLALMLGACTWVQLTPTGSKVRVLEPADVGTCKRIGTTSSKVVAVAAGLERRKDKVAAELIALASNTAASMGGDTIVPETEIQDGRQTFVVYKCVNPENR